jgi:hypothetical protein
MRYVLCRIEDDATTTLVSEHESIFDGVAAGKRVVEVEDFDFAYALYCGPTRVARFSYGRVGYREWERRRWAIHSIDDRYDKDVDELIG